LGLCLNEQSQHHAQNYYIVAGTGRDMKKPWYRGDDLFWLTDDYEKIWLYAGEKQCGSQFDYSDQAIEIMLTIREVFQLSNRSVETGFRLSHSLVSRNSNSD
jgi:hypothetical protein